MMTFDFTSIVSDIVARERTLSTFSSSSMCVYVCLKSHNECVHCWYTSRSDFVAVVKWRRDQLRLANI